MKEAPGASLQTVVANCLVRTPILSPTMAVWGSVGGNVSGEADARARWRRLRLTRPQVYKAARLLGLSAREASVALHFINDRSRCETARRLGLSTSTINSYAERIYIKLGVHSKTQLTKTVFDEAWQRLLREP